MVGGKNMRLNVILLVAIIATLAFANVGFALCYQPADRQECIDAGCQEIDTCWYDDQAMDWYNNAVPSESGMVCVNLCAGSPGVGASTSGDESIDVGDPWTGTFNIDEGQNSPFILSVYTTYQPNGGIVVDCGSGNTWNSGGSPGDSVPNTEGWHKWDNAMPDIAGYYDRLTQIYTSGGGPQTCSVTIAGKGAIGLHSIVIETSDGKGDDIQFPEVWPVGEYVVPINLPNSYSLYDGDNTYTGQLGTRIKNGTRIGNESNVYIGNSTYGKWNVKLDLTGISGPTFWTLTNFALEREDLGSGKYLLSDTGINLGTVWIK